MNVKQLAETAKALPAILHVATGVTVSEIALGEASVLLMTWTHPDGAQDALYVTMTEWENISPNLLIQKVVRRIVLSTLDPITNTRH